MNEFLSLVQRRLARRRDGALLARVRDDATYLREAAAARVHLRECSSLGAFVRVAGRPHVENQGRIEVGGRTRFICTHAPVELRTGPDGALRIGSQGSINFGTLICASSRVSVGDRVGIGPYCVIADTDVADVRPRPGSVPQPIEIGDDVWLASRVTVLPGARIGAGSVITAGSVVSGEIPPGVVAGGTPARVLRGLAKDGAEVHASNGAAGHAVPATPEAVRPPVSHHGVVIADFTADEFVRCLQADALAPGLAAVAAPYGQVVPTLMAPKDPGHDFAVVWTRPQAVLPSFAKLLEFEPVDDAVLLAEVDQFAALLLEGLKDYRAAFVPTWVVPPWHRGLGLVDARTNGVTRALHAVNERLIERLAAAPKIFVLNAQRWIEEAGRGAHSAKAWYLGKVPFSTAVFEHATLDIKAGLQGLAGMARKLVVVDLDDTLWGGIVGDVGWEQLRLGGHDSLGEAFVDFQRALKSLKKRGILLAMVSKNDEAVALEAIRRHSEMVLREEDFVAWRINWQDKARNIADLVAGLNLGLQSTVFIDDNPFERARVREALPEVYVPEWPEDKLAYASALLSLRCFDAPAITTEDAARTEMYATERKREELRANVGSLDEWLRSLGIRVRLERLGAANLARTTQLLNKTNQMNLSTRRLTEAELLEWVAKPRHWFWTISVSDRLGDAGLTGILSLEADGDVARIVDFVLSCRVMGRRVEETMAHLAVEAARAEGLRQVVAELLPTAKNRPCLEFWQRSGFAAEGEHRFTWDCGKDCPLPNAITLERVG